MDGGLAAAGDIATGAVWARTVEPSAGQIAKGHYTSGACANCCTALTGAFCANCGQHGHVHRTAGALVHDLAHGVFHFEGKFWGTLPLLAWRPGELTRRYVHGERAKFVSPMALFLFSVFLMFAIVSHLPGMKLGPNLNAKVNMAEEQRKAGAEIGRLEQRIAKEQARSPGDAQALARLMKRLKAVQEDRQGLDQAARLLPGASSVVKPAEATEGWLRFQNARKNPQLLLYKLQSSAYKYSWALIPISLPFIWLLFPFRRDVGLYDHAIFATYSLSFMSLLVVILALLGWIGVPGGLIGAAAFLVPPVHLYRQLKGAYRLGRVGALWRTGWMLVFATITSTAFALMLLYLGTAD